MKISISKSLIGIALLAFVLGPVMAFRDQQYAQAVVLALCAASAIGLYCLMSPAVRPLAWIGGRMKLLAILMLLVLLFWCVMLFSVQM